MALWKTQHRTYCDMTETEQDNHVTWRTLLAKIRKAIFEWCIRRGVKLTAQLQNDAYVERISQVIEKKQKNSPITRAVSPHYYLSRKDLKEYENIFVSSEPMFQLRTTSAYWPQEMK